jgi:ribosomal protein S18 acetylase RimI-like enzyme
MSEDLQLSIRPVRAEDLPKLDALGHRAPGLARHRLEGQEKNLSLFFLALLGEEVVAHAVLTWVGPAYPPVNDCAHVTDVWVRPDWRRHGIASALLEACESVARDQDFGCLGLSVGVDNPGAQALYARHGYTDIGVAPYVESGRWTDANGKLVEWAETCVFLTKDLGALGR